MASPTLPVRSGARLDGDLRDQALVLDRLLVQWPTPLQESDLRRELGLGADGFEQHDRIDRAVAELCGAGLALRSGSVVLPTRAALHYRALGEHTPVDL